MNDCVFCKIVRGELPCDAIYSDELVIAFLDIAPIAPGHTLIVPKEHHTSVTTLPDDLGARMMKVAPRIGRAVMRVTEAGGFNLLLSNGAVAGQVVPHVHLHVIPRSADDGIILPTRTIPYATDERKQDIVNRTKARLAVESHGTC